MRQRIKTLISALGVIVLLCATNGYSAPTQKPVFTSADTVSGKVGTYFSFYLTATNTPTSYTATGLPGGLYFSSASARIYGTPTVSGISNIPVSATNSKGTTYDTLKLTILPTIPVITGPYSMQGIVGQPLTYTITAYNNPIFLNAIGLPSGFTVDTATGVISGTPIDTGHMNVVLLAGNGAGTAYDTISLVITPEAPVITSASSVNGKRAMPFSFTLTATNNPKYFTATGLTSIGLKLVDSTGVISGYPNYSGTFNVTVRAYNPTASTAETLTIFIDTTNCKITSSRTATGGTGVSFEYQTTTPRSDVTFSAYGLPTGTSINATTGLISGVPNKQGVYRAGISTYLNNVYLDSSNVVFTIDSVNGCTTPQITNKGLMKRIASANVPFSDTVLATDVDSGSTLRYSIFAYNRNGIINIPIDSLSGIISWIPAVNDTGYQIFVSVTVRDNTGLVDTTSYTMFVSYSKVVVIEPAAAVSSWDSLRETTVYTLATQGFSSGLSVDMTFSMLPDSGRITTDFIDTDSVGGQNKPTKSVAVLEIESSIPYMDSMINADIHVPYDPNVLDGGSELDIIVKYFNQSVDIWEDIPYTIDTVANVVVIHTPHFSVYGLFIEEHSTVVEMQSAPAKSGLDGILPNPFNPSTTIAFSISEHDAAFPVNLSVYTANGRLVGTLVNGRLTAGVHHIAWNGRMLSTGTYVFRLKAGNKVETKRAVLMR